MTRRGDIVIVDFPFTEYPGSYLDPPTRRRTEDAERRFVRPTPNR